MDQRPDVNPDPRRRLPSVDRLARQVCEKRSDLPLWAATAVARRMVEEAREGLARGDAGSAARAEMPQGDGKARWLEPAVLLTEQLARVRPAPVLNATGVVLHTNLGRAPLAPGAVQAAARAAAGYSDLELDLSTGRRGDRLGSLAAKLRLLSGAEAATACNNNAAAVLLALDSLARGREVVVSRGELVEIGGSFRIPEIVERAGVKLVEVGTTNRTHPKDYEAAIGPDTALLLKVHRSNFEQRGFVSEVGLAELVAIGRARGVPVVEDLGSGSLVDLTDRGIPASAHAPSSVKAGADIVCFSGDKLLGGPQAGIALGRHDAIGKMRRNPLARALRLDKMTLAALDWTLTATLDGRAESEVPTLRQLLASVESLDRRAHSLLERLRRTLAHSLGDVSLEVESDTAPVGGGSLPGFELETRVVALRAKPGPERLLATLRAAPVPVLARVRDASVLFDLRTLDDDDFELIEEAVGAALR